MHYITAVCAIILSAQSCFAQESKVYNLVYHNIDVTAYSKCIRLMNGTSQIGCQSSLEGDVGVLFHVNSSDRINEVVLGKHPPYVVLLPADLFNKHAIDIFRMSGKVSGVAVYSKDNYTGKTTGWSPELQCPRFRYGLYNKSHGSQYAICEKNPWNSFGDGLLEEDIPFPVFILVNYMWSEMLIDCFNKHNLDDEYPLCAAEMKSRMDGAQSSETCLRRNNLQNNLSPTHYCDVIGGRTILTTLQATNSSSGGNQKSNILLTAALDSRSFDMLTSPGANSATGFITMLATAQALGKLNSTLKESMQKNVLFLLFDGETFDNMASTRMVYDMSNNKFPFELDNSKWQPNTVNLSEISHIIEFGQLGMIDMDVWMHFDPISYTDSGIQSGISEIIHAISEYTSGPISFKNQSSGIGLVPSSLQSVLSRKNVSGVVVTDFDKQYEDEFYFSRYDTLEKLGIKPNGSLSEEEALVDFLPLAMKLSNVSTTIARAVYKLATGKGNEEIFSDVNMISRILYCYLYRANCSLFKEMLQVGVSTKLANFPPSRYVGVYKKKVANGPVYFARNLFVSFTGVKIEANSSTTCKSDDSKDQINQYFLFQGSMANISTYTCVHATVYDMDGRSPSSVISKYDYANGPYSTWTESAWSRTAFNFRIFLIQDEVTQGMVLFSGLLMFFSSMAIVYIINKKSSILFANEIL